MSHTVLDTKHKNNAEKESSSHYHTSTLQTRARAIIHRMARHHRHPVHLLLPRPPSTPPHHLWIHNQIRGRRQPHPIHPPHLPISIPTHHYHPAHPHPRIRKRIGRPDGSGGKCVFDVELSFSCFLFFFLPSSFAFALDETRHDR